MSEEFVSLIVDMVAEEN